MAKHRTATEVTVAPLAERSKLEQWVEDYWKFGLLVFGVIAAGILYRQYRSEQVREVQDQGWAQLQGMITVDDQFGMPSVKIANPEPFERFAGENADTGAGAWALLMAAKGHVTLDEYDAALANLDAFASGHPTHPHVTQQLQFGDVTRSVVEEVRARIQSLAELRAELPGLAGNPPPPADAPQVVLHTSEGDITLGLYEAEAPQHVANFLKLTGEGTYAGTKFHRSMVDFMIQAGDQNSIAGTPDTWGQGDAGYTIPQEFSDLSHFSGVLAMAKRPDQVESGGHQFYITVGTPMHLDGVHTIFGAVTDGMDVVRRIVGRPNVEGTDRPLEAVVIESAEVL